MTKTTDRAFRTVDIQMELRMAAPPAKVWRALTSEIGRWWPAKFYVGRAPVRFTLEPEVGGRVFEDWGDGEGTRVKLRDTMFGELSEQMGPQLEHGWGFLMKDCLQPYVESGKQPERPETVVAHERSGG